MACLLAAFVPVAHASAVRADKLPSPKSMACLQLKQSISYSMTRGLLRIPFDIELGQGAYVSEHEDAKGVYFRAPPGSITERRSDVKKESPAGRAMTFDGGIYVPNDPATAPTLYKYYATETGVTRFAPDKTDCTALTYTVDPHTNKVNVLATGASVGIGAATGMAIGRSMHPQTHMSYGQAAGVGLVGGLIGGLIIGAIENSKIGEIVPGPALDGQAGDKIRALVASKVVMGERGHAIAPAAGAADTDPSVHATSMSAEANAEEPAINAPAQAGISTEASNAPPEAVTANPPSLSRAQGVANQLGCGAVKASGDSGYVASCGSYGVYIDCDADRCRPSHTVKMEGNQ